MTTTADAIAELDLERATTGEAPQGPSGSTNAGTTPKQPHVYANTRPDPPECVKSLQRCAARMEEWEKKQAVIARQREYQSSPPNQPEPLFQRFFTVPLVAVILSWVCIVYVWRILRPALASSPTALATHAEGIVLCAFFGILWSMTVWCWVVAVIKQPGNAKDYVPQQAAMPADAQAPVGQALQEPILYNGPIAAQPAVPAQTADEGVREPPGLFSAAIPIATSPEAEGFSARPRSDESAVLGTSVAPSGAGTDTTAVSPSRLHFNKSVAEEDGKKGEHPQTHKSAGQQDDAADSNSVFRDDLFPRQRGRASSIASSVTGLPPSPKFEQQEVMNDQFEAVGSQPQNLGTEGTVQIPLERIRDSQDSYGSDVMPGGLPAHAKEYDCEAAEKQQQLNAAGQRSAATTDGPAFMPLRPAPDSTQPPPPPQRLHHLPVPQRYPNFWTTDEVSSGYCRWCNIVKPPRTHHCRKCGTCVLKMDHHCPWVGGCVGAQNYRFFLLFVFWVSALEVFVSISNAVLFARGVARRRQAGGSGAWPIDGYMISLFPICAIFGLFTLTLTGAHTYLVCRNLSTIEEMGRSSRHHREDAILDAWARQTVEQRRAALEEFERWGGYSYLIRNRQMKKRRGPALLAQLPELATAASDQMRQKEIAALQKKAEDMLLMQSDYASCGLQLAPKSFLRTNFLENGPWTSERTDANPFWLGGSAEHGPVWEKLCRLVEERLELEGEEVLSTGTTKADKEGGNLTSGRENKKRYLDRQISRLQRHTGGGIGGVVENVKQVFGTRPWEWFLPIGKPAQDGLAFPVNPRFGPDGVRRPRDQWPLPLR